MRGTSVLSRDMAWHFGAAVGLGLAVGTATGASPGAARLTCDAGAPVYFACDLRNGTRVRLCENAPNGLLLTMADAKGKRSAYPSPDAGAQNNAGFLYAEHSRFQSMKVEVRYVTAPTEGSAPINATRAPGSLERLPATDTVAPRQSLAVFDYSEGRSRWLGVDVTDAEGRSEQALCKGKAVSRLVMLKTVLPCDTDSALNVNTCAAPRAR